MGPEELYSPQLPVMSVTFFRRRGLRAVLLLPRVRPVGEEVADSGVAVAPLAGVAGDWAAADYSVLSREQESERESVQHWLKKNPKSPRQPPSRKSFPGSSPAYGVL